MKRVRQIIKSRASFSMMRSIKSSQAARNFAEGAIGCLPHRQGHIMMHTGGHKRSEAILEVSAI